jgi:alpha-2-macroglobulin
VNTCERGRGLSLALGVCAFAFLAGANEYQPADRGERPRDGSSKVLPEKFLRGFDPVTVYFDSNQAPGPGSADDGEKFLKIVPPWPGAYFWADRKTLQFRPAEPWPPLARFAVDAKGARRVLTTMMSAPSSMSPSADSTELRPFRTITLTFPQALPMAALKSMIRIEIRDLPGLADSPRRAVKDFNLALLPRATARDAATYAVTLNDDVPEGKQLQVQVSLALGEEDKVLWTGRLSTRTPFHLDGVSCGGSRFPLLGGASVPRDMALSCGNAGQAPVFEFSSPVKDLTLTELKKFVHLDPAVPDLSFETRGSRVALYGKFIPDVLYRMRVAAAPIHDDADRALRDPGDIEIYFYLGWKSPFLRWNQSTAVLEANGPRMLPAIGYGDTRADVRVYRIDPLFSGLWPFSREPLVVREERDPPFPGEEPETPRDPRESVDRNQLIAHIRLLGSPLVSRIVDLPLANHSAATRFGLDLGPLLDPVVGSHQPGTYLVGLRRLTGTPERTYMRVQITNLSLTAVEEHDRAVFFVQTLDRAAPVRGARINFEVLRREKTFEHGRWITRDVPDHLEVSTNGDGRAELAPQGNWTAIRRISVRNDDDVLVIDPNEPPPIFANNHWSVASNFLQWLTQPTPPSPNEKTIAFVFTERPIYRPGETVFIKGYVRRKLKGELVSPGPDKAFGLKVDGPDGHSWNLPISFTALAGFNAEFKEKDPPTGAYTATLFQREPYAVVGQRPFQIEAYRIPTFEVQLSGSPTVRLDQPFKVKAVARYYAGGNVSGQPISWNVTRRPYHYVPKGREGYLFASSAQFARPAASKPAESISRNGTLDEHGADEISINPALDIDGSPRIYDFEATVTGPDNQPVTAVHEAKALPPFLIGMKLPRYSEKAVALKPEMIAVGVDDKLVKGQEITVRLYRRVWHSHLRETNFASGEARYVTEQEDVKLAEKTVVTEERPVNTTFDISEAGVYLVELVARDKLGRVQSISADLYLGGPAPVAWQKPREGVFELVADKKTYRPGDTARVIVKSPFQTGKALVVVEQPGGNSYAWEDVGGGKAVYNIPIRAENVPNLPVHVVLTRGRIGEGKSDDARYKPETVASSLDLEIEPVRNQITVKVEHPDTVRPGTKVDLIVTLRDDQKRPIPGEVTLWLVDEAVLSLAPEQPLDPLTQFIDRNQRGTSIRDTRNTIIGKLLDEDEPGGGGDESETEGKAKPRVRRNFQTVPYYAATLLVDASGRLVVPVTVSDDLTNFKVRAVASSGWTRFGLDQSTLRVRLPVIVQPQLPRFVRQGDRFWAGGVARVLEGAEGPGVADIEVSGPADGKGGKQPVALQLNHPLSVLVPFTARSADPSNPGEIAIRTTVTRNSDGVGDAFEVKLPLLPDRIVEHYAYFARLGEGHKTLQPFPETPRSGTASQRILVTSIPGILELVSALDYLAEYPHGCLEQRISQVYPEVALREIMHKFDLEPGFASRGPSRAKIVLDELGVYQDEQGFFAYWPGGVGDVTLTAEVAEFMEAAKRTGMPVNEKIQTRTVEALRRVLRSDFTGFLTDYRYDQQSAAIRALSRNGQLDEHYLIELFNNRDGMDVSSLADLTSAMALEPKVFSSNLGRLKNELWDSVVVKLHGGKPVFDGLKWRRASWSYGYLGSNTSAVAAVTESLLLVDPENPRLEFLRDALLSYASPTTGFGSTHDNRRAIMALALYLDKAKFKVPKTTVAIAGHGETSVDEKRKTAQLTFQSDQPLSLDVKGPEIGMRAAYAYLPMTPGDQVKAAKQGFLVSRGATVIPADGSAETHFDDGPGASKKLHLGDVVEIHARLVNSEDRYQVALVVPFAAGLEPLNPALANVGAIAQPSQADSMAPTYVQRLDHEVRYYFTHLPSGTYSFHFRVRAASEGSFVHPAPYAEMMYRQEVRGRGDGMRLVVQGDHEK